MINKYVDEVKAGLEEIHSNVQHGICRKKDTWDCLLIKKDRVAKSGTSNLDNTFYLTVSIICEDEIPEGKQAEVEQKMKEMGYRRTTAAAEFDYTIDANEVVIEVCTIEFSKPTKRVK